MKNKSKISAALMVSVFMLLCACGNSAVTQPAVTAEEGVVTPTTAPAVTAVETIEETDTVVKQEEAEEKKEEDEMKDPVLLYQGHASLRIVTGEDKVIYVDPFCGEGYDMPADLILQTHDHFDHKDLKKIKNRSDDCVVITQKEALKDGEYQINSNRLRIFCLFTHWI